MVGAFRVVGVLWCQHLCWWEENDRCRRRSDNACYGCDGPMGISATARSALRFMGSGMGRLVPVSIPSISVTPSFMLCKSSEVIWAVPHSA